MTKKNISPAPNVADAAVSRKESLAEKTISLSALKEQEAGLRRAQQMANLAHVITRPDGSFESWSETLPELIGLTAEQIATSTRKWLELVHPADRELFRNAALAARSEAKRADLEYRLWRNDGTWIYVRQVMEPIPGRADAEGRMRWFNTLQDVTAQKRAEERIKRLNRVYAVLSGINSLIVRVRGREELFKEACDLAIKHGNFRMAWIGLVDRDSQAITAVASAGDVQDFFSFARLSMVEGRPGFGLSGRALRDLKPAVSHDIQRDPSSFLKDYYVRRGINSLCMLPLIVGGKGAGVMALYAPEVGFFDADEMRLLLELAGDISFAIEHIEKSEKAEYLAYYDPLTGLANRTLFHERLAQHVETARTEGRSLALVIMDIERFKTINDTMGRQAGDALLVQIADRMVQQMPMARVARIGSDLFAAAVPDVSGEELARRIEESLKAWFGTPYRLRDAELRVSARLGIALFPTDAVDSDALFRNAEAALKKAKKAGEHYLFYEQKMTERVAEKLALENKLRQALENGEFVLHYQPKVDLERRAMVGVEGLLRWKSPELGLVPPLNFVHLLEETGLIQEVGSWVIQQASLDHRLWVEQGFNIPRVAVNVSPIQLRQRNFVRLVERSIMGGLTPTGIDLEITESVIMEDIQANIEKLHALRELGIDVAIDDFGTGYSSLGYLAKLPVQCLKIDRSFVIAMQQDPNAMTLVSTIISLAHSLKLKVVAEGVETEEQAKILRLLRCDEMQGYLFSKPLPIEALLALMRSQPPAG
jgi:diguanylate cyclase (GGDEF)-like protein/PAS domain S-box-containing protein